MWPDELTRKFELPMMSCLNRSTSRRRVESRCVMPSSVCSKGGEKHFSLSPQAAESIFCSFHSCSKSIEFLIFARKVSPPRQHFYANIFLSVNGPKQISSHLVHLLIRIKLLNEEIIYEHSAVLRNGDGWLLINTIKSSSKGVEYLSLATFVSIYSCEIIKVSGSAREWMHGLRLIIDLWTRLSQH